MDNKDLAFKLFNDYMNHLKYLKVDVIVDKNKKEHLLTFRFKEDE